MRERRRALGEGWFMALVLGVVAGCGTVALESGAIGAECALDDECAEGAYCHEAGVCVEGCLDDDGCAAGEHCSASRCLPDQAQACPEECDPGYRCVAGQCDNSCSQCSDCGDGFSCREGFCQPSYCQQDDQCGERGICTRGLCEPVECRENGHCASDAVCVDHACVPVGQCLHDQHCASGRVCVEGSCVGEAAGIAVAATGQSPCETNHDCGWKQYCVRAVCEYTTECAGHAQCAAGEGCFLSLCWPIG